MSCREFEDDLIDYADGDQPADRRALVEAHLAGCSSCRAALVEIRSMLETAKAPVPDPGEAYFESVTNRIMNRIREEESVSPIKRAISRLVAAIRRPAMALVPVAAAIALAIYMLAGPAADPQPTAEEIAGIESLARQYSLTRVLQLAPVTILDEGDDDTGDDGQLVSAILSGMAGDTDVAEVIDVENGRTASRTAFAAGYPDLSDEEVDQLQEHLSQALEGLAI